MNSIFPERLFLTLHVYASKYIFLHQQQVLFELIVGETLEPDQRSALNTLLQRYTYLYIRHIDQAIPATGDFFAFFSRRANSRYFFSGASVLPGDSALFIGCDNIYFAGRHDNQHRDIRLQCALDTCNGSTLHLQGRIVGEKPFFCTTNIFRKALSALIDAGADLTAQALRMALSECVWSKNHTITVQYQSEQSGREIWESRKAAEFTTLRVEGEKLSRVQVCHFADFDAQHYLSYFSSDSRVNSFFCSELDAYEHYVKYGVYLGYPAHSRRDEFLQWVMSKYFKKDEAQVWSLTKGKKLADALSEKGVIDFESMMNRAFFFGTKDQFVARWLAEEYLDVSGLTTYGRQLLFSITCIVQELFLKTHDFLYYLLNLSVLLNESDIQHARILFSPSPTDQYEKDKPLIALFAGYSQSKLIDASVIDYVSRLSTVAEVYYSADCNFPEQELVKVTPFIKAAYCSRHRAGQWGAYAKMLRLIHPIDIKQSRAVVFASDRYYPVSAFETFLDMPVSSRQVSGYIGFNESSDHGELLIDPNFFKVDSSLLLENTTFRRFLSGYDPSWFAQLGLDLKEALSVCLRMDGAEKKFALDFTCTGKALATRQAFELLVRGYPFILKGLLGANPYGDEAVDVWRDNLARAGVSQLRLEKLADSVTIQYPVYQIKTAQTRYPLQQEEKITGSDYVNFIDHNSFASVDKNKWAFAVDVTTHQLASNELMLIDYVSRNNKDIEVVIFLRSKDVFIEPHWTNVSCVPMESSAALRAFSCCGYVFLRTIMEWDYTFPFELDGNKRVINLWHGIPLKGIGYLDAALDGECRIGRTHKVICSSKVDRLSMALSFGKPAHDVLVTGLPRHDIILAEEHDLPSQLASDSARVRQSLAGKKLFLFAPTYRQFSDKSYFPELAPAEVAELKRILAENNLVIGLRHHPVDKVRPYKDIFENNDIDFINFEYEDYPLIEPVFKNTSVFCTDFSGAFFDYMLTGKPCMCFAYDYHTYNRDRNFIYRVSSVFPGAICLNYGELIKELARLVSPGFQIDYMDKRNLFFDFMDANNSSRVYEAIMTDKETFF